MNVYAEAFARLVEAERAYDRSVDRYMAAVRELDRVYLEAGMHRVEYTEARLVEATAKKLSDEAHNALRTARREYDELGKLQLGL